MALDTYWLLFFELYCTAVAHYSSAITTARPGAAAGAPPGGSNNLQVLTVSVIAESIQSTITVMYSIFPVKNKFSV